MAKVGIFLLGTFLIIVFARFVKPAMDSIFYVMNTTMSTTFTLSPAESMIWRLMPLIIPAILFGLLIAYVTGHTGHGEDRD